MYAAPLLWNTVDSDIILFPFDALKGITTYLYLKYERGGISGSSTHARYTLSLLCKLIHIYLFIDSQCHLKKKKNCNVRLILDLKLPSSCAL